MAGKCQYAPGGKNEGDSAQPFVPIPEEKQNVTPPKQENQNQQRQRNEDYTQTESTFH
jgi:hypothetical protein